MSRTCLFFLIALFAVTSVLARSTAVEHNTRISAATNPGLRAKATCGKHGDACSPGCCDGFRCNPYASKCMAIITSEDLINQRKKLRHVEINAHKRN